MKRSDIMAEVRQRVGDEAKAITDDYDLQTWVNLAVRACWKHHPWPFTRKQATVTTVNGTQDYALPADFIAFTKAVDTTNNVTLVPKPDRWLQYVYSAADKGAPLFYTEGAFSQPDPTAGPPTRQVRIYPTPDQAYSVKVTYIAGATDMTDDGQYTPLPQDFDEAVILWVMYRYYKKLDDVQNAADAYREYQGEMQELVNRFSSWNQERYPIVESFIDPVGPGSV